MPKLMEASPKKNVLLQFRVSEKEAGRIDESASRLGLNRSDYMRFKILVEDKAKWQSEKK